MKRVLAAVLFLGGTPLAADQVFLKGGGLLNGVVVERTATSIVIEVAPGRVTLPASRVDHVVQGTSALATFRERSARLSADDLAGWLTLAQWALDSDLRTPARGAFEHVASLDPNNAAARRGLGQSLVDGEWLNEADAHRARGLVLFGGEWMTPGERDAAIREEEARSLASAARIEAEARAREAEARASAAEAEARRADASAQADDWGGGIPYGWVIGGGGGPCRFGCGHGVTPRPPRPTSPGMPPPHRTTPRAASTGATHPKTVH
ncbi:MAG: hypothetical protein ACHQNV_10215 [Vicinamibacteria bacterium]